MNEQASCFSFRLGRVNQHGRAVVDAVHHPWLKLIQVVVSEADGWGGLSVLLLHWWVSTWEEVRGDSSSPLCSHIATVPLWPAANFDAALNRS